MSVRFGVLSTATICAKVVPALQEVAEVVCIGEEFGRGLLDAEEAATKFGIDTAYGSFQQVLDDERVTAVYIPLSTALKARWALKAANKGKHVLCEKGLPELYVLDRILQACAEHNVVWMDGTTWVHALRTPIMLQAMNDCEPLRIDVGFTWQSDKKATETQSNVLLNPLGTLSALVWCPLSAALAIMDFALPQRIQVLHVATRNGAIVSVTGVLFWNEDQGDGVVCTFTGGCQAAHRSYITVSGRSGSVQTDDFVAGQGAEGGFSRYLQPFKGASSFRVRDVLGHEQVVDVDASNQTEELVRAFVKQVASSTGGSWPERSRSMQMLTEGVALSVAEGIIVGQRFSDVVLSNGTYCVQHDEPRRDASAASRVSARLSRALSSQRISDEALQLDSIERCDAYATTQSQNGPLGRAIVKALRKKTASFAIKPGTIMRMSDSGDVANTSEQEGSQDSPKEQVRIRKRDVLRQKLRFPALRRSKAREGGA